MPRARSAMQEKKKEQFSILQQLIIRFRIIGRTFSEDQESVCNITILVDDLFVVSDDFFAVRCLRATKVAGGALQSAE